MPRFAGTPGRPALSILATVALAAAIAAGCSGKPERTLAGASNLTIAMYRERESPPADDRPPALAERFEKLPRRTDLPAAADAAQPGAAADGQKHVHATDGVDMPPGAPEGRPGAKPASSSAPPGFIDPLTKTGERVAVTLESCLRRALVGSLRIQIARYGPAVALTAVREAEAMFDPSWFMNNALARVRQDAGTFLAGAGTLSAKQWESSSGVDALLPTGGSFAFSQDWTYLDSNSAFFAPNPQYATQLGLTVRQPLLRGAGVEVTRSPITLARLDHRISVEQFKAEVMDALLTVEAAYWQLVLSESQVEAIAEAVAAAEENRRIARRRFEEGKDTRVILSLAESAVTSREADLVAARLRLVRLSDLLKRLIQDPALPLEEPSVLMASETPMSEPPSVDRRTLQSAMLTAMARRPEMQQAEQRLEQAGVQVRVARSDRLPQLDFAGGYAVTGLEADLDRSLREEYQTEFFNWTVGLAFRVPIGNRAREAAYERTRLVQSQAIQQREDTRQRVLLEVSETVRTLAAAEESVRATRAARVAAEQTLRDQQANVAAGAALVKDLLDSQRDLADSKVREMDAMVQYMTALAALERAKGTLLEYNGIAILEEDAGSRAAKRP